MSFNAVSEYKANSVTTQTPGRIVVMLYDGAIRFLKEALAAIERNDFAEKGLKIDKALAIINELNSSLDVQAGGEIAENLRRLYLFMQEHLVFASMRKDKRAIADVISLLEQINAGWREIAS